MKTPTFGLACAIAASSALALDVELTRKEEIAITAGVIYALTDLNELNDLEGCVEGAHSFVTKILHAVHLAKQWDLRSIISAYRLIADAVHHLPETIGDCVNAPEDLADFFKYCSGVLHPHNLVQTIAANAHDNLPFVTVNVLKAKKDFENEEYFAFGDEIGTMLFVLAKPIEDPQVEAFLQ